MQQRAFCTVITRSYLADARALARSIRRFHDEPIYVLCVDAPTGYFDAAAEPFHVLTLEDVLPAEDRGMLFYYTAFEMCNAIRPYLHRYMLEATEHESWIYIDSDCQLVASLSPAFEEMRGATSGLVTPHCLAPAPVHLLEPVETSLLQYGVYNSGFVALRRSPETAAFIKWFADRLQRLCFFEERGCYVDQRWLNLLPEHFPSIRPWRHPGANVAYWNCHERAIRRNGDLITANGEPLLFMHFSRWKIAAPERWEFGRTVHPDTDNTVTAQLGHQYAAELTGCGFRECRAWPYEFAAFNNGRKITLRMRRDYYDQWLRDETAESPPFDAPGRFPWTRYPPDMMPTLRRLARPIKGIRRLLTGKPRPQCSR